jgi:hypothetical protein
MQRQLRLSLLSEKMDAESTLTDTFSRHTSLQFDEVTATAGSAALRYGLTNSITQTSSHPVQMISMLIKTIQFTFQTSINAVQTTVIPIQTTYLLILHTPLLIQLLYLLNQMIYPFVQMPYTQKLNIRLNRPNHYLNR